MKIPNSFKKAMKDTFYDKEVKRFSKEEKNDHGWITYELTDLTDPFMANVQFQNLGKIQEDYGLKEEFEVAMTTDEDVSVGTIIEYDSIKYKVNSAIPHDSHNLLTAVKWENE